MPITKFYTQVDEEADEEALPLVASSFADYSTFCFNDRGETSGLAMILVHRNNTHIHQWKYLSRKSNWRQLNNRSIKAH